MPRTPPPTTIDEFREAYPDTSTYQQLPDSPTTPQERDIPHVDDQKIEPDAGEEEEDGVYDISALRAIGTYRRSGAWGAPVAAAAAAGGLIQRGIEVVKRPDSNAVKGGLLAGYRRAGDPVATASAPGAGGRPKDGELAGRYAQPRSPPTSSHLQKTSSPTNIQTSDISVSEEEEEEPSEEEEEEDMEEEESWIASFCNIVGHEYFAEVSEEFIEDDFNLTGLGAMVPMYKEALEMILDVQPEDDSDSLASASESLSEQPNTSAPNYRRRSSHVRVASDLSVIESSAELLYGLIHQRFITSRQGIQIMYEKYLGNHFGFCPRVYCNNARVLPCAYSDAPGVETVKLFCPSCCDIYIPPNSRFQTVDGAFFGTTFASLFLMTFPELDVSGNGRKDLQIGTMLNSAGGKKGVNNSNALVVNGIQASNLAPGLGKGKQYEMRIYGFRVSERAKSGPRMGWLRSRPEDIKILDETAIMGEIEGGVGYTSEEEEEGVDDSEGEDEMAVIGGTKTQHRRGGGSPMDTNLTR